MYMAYGWPQVIPLEQGLRPSSQRIIYFKVINGLFLVVSPSHLELWSSSQHKVRMGKYKRDADSLRREGENSQAVWSPDAKLIAVLTTSLYLHLFKVQFSEKRVQIGGKQPSGLYFATISLLLSEQVPFADVNLSVSNMVSDNRHMLLGLSDGSLYGISWKGEFCGAIGLDHPIQNDSDKVTDLPYPISNGITAIVNPGAPISQQNSIKRPAIVQLELCFPMRLLFVLYADGQLMLCSVG